MRITCSFCIMESMGVWDDLGSFPSFLECLSYLPNFVFQNIQDIDLSTDSLGSGMELPSAVDNILPLEDGSPKLVQLQH